jgi:hypothetical protein
MLRELAGGPPCTAHALDSSQKLRQSAVVVRIKLLNEHETHAGIRLLMAQELRKGSDSQLTEPSNACHVLPAMSFTGQLFGGGPRTRTTA